MFSLSPRGTVSSITAASFSTPRLSPVSALSSALMPAFVMILPSAGTKSPASRLTRSPTVISAAGILMNCPFLNTLASGADIFLRLSSDCSAFTVCTVPSMAFIVITISITTALSMSPSIPDTTAASMSIITRKSLNCSRKMRTMDFFLPSASSLGPYFSRFAATASSVIGSVLPLTAIIASRSVIL